MYHWHMRGKLLGADSRMPLWHRLLPSTSGTWVWSYEHLIGFAGLQSANVIAPAAVGGWQLLQQARRELVAVDQQAGETPPAGEREHFTPGRRRKRLLQSAPQVAWPQWQHL